MNVICILLSGIFLSTAVHTGVVIWRHGTGLFPILFGDIEGRKFNWGGLIDVALPSRITLGDACSSSPSTIAAWASKPGVGRPSGAC